MTSAPKICRKCGGEIFADAPEGLCTACLFETGLTLFADKSVAGVVGPGCIEGEQARDQNKTPTKIFADFGDYELLEVIGRGGQGVVYRARQKGLNRTVALKVIGLGHWASETHLKRFRREAEAAANLDHPGIVPIYEVGERDGCCYFSMKLVEGGQLDVIAGREPMPIRQAVELIAKVARTVHYAHEHGILHRDIKPGNILLDQKREPHLTDFGLARLIETDSTVTRTQEVLGTPSYMAPEQAVGNNEAVSRPTDVYEIGAVLYHLLTGQPPFAGGTTYETIRLLLDTEPRPPRLLNSKIDRDLSTICLKCVEKDPKRRYSSALALAEDLERWLRHEPILARHTWVIARSRKWIRRNMTTAALFGTLAVLAIIVALLFFNREPPKPAAGIAVLPFENIDGDRADAILVDGLQDDILTRLAKVASLKVISRTSVMQYRGVRNMQQIRDRLHVSHVLEGSVRREGDIIRLNAQLIDTQTDAHVWAEHYDQPVSDIFAVQTDLARKVADQLHVKLSPREKDAIEQRPTNDVAAYSLWTEARSAIDQADLSQGKEQVHGYSRAIELLNQATARDPTFLLAYCQLAEAHDEIYFYNVDHTQRRLDLAQSAIDSAFKLQPDSGEAHLALASHLYRAYFDYDHARDELEIARRALPNNARIFQWSGLIDRRQNRWHDAVRDVDHAVELDPQNLKVLFTAENTHALLRDYNKTAEIHARAEALHPERTHEMGRAWLAIFQRADTRALHAALASKSPDDPETAVDRFKLALFEHDTAAAERALPAVVAEEGDAIGIDGTRETGFCQEYVEALIARMRGDAAGAQNAFTAARVKEEDKVRARPELHQNLCALGLTDAGLGRKEDALREGRRAVELAVPEKDALDTAEVVYYYAAICAWVGERDLAIEQLQTSAKMPAGVNYMEIRLDPHWDPLRGDPGFEKIVASLAPK